jgi:hypothetical protein
LELWIVQIMIQGRPIIWHTMRLNCYADGGLLLEHLQAIETDGRQTPGPSELVSLPAGSGAAENDISVAWPHGSCIVKRDGSQSTSMILKLKTLDNPATWQEIRLLLIQDGSGLLEHSLRVQDGNGENYKLIVHQSC